MGSWGRDQDSHRAEAAVLRQQTIIISPIGVGLLIFLPTNSIHMSFYFFLGCSTVPRKSWGLCCDCKIIM